MAKDDYYVIVFKILVYLYAVFRGKEVFRQERYDKAIGKKNINEEYLLRIYKMMSDEGYIEKLSFTRAWGSDLIPLFDEGELKIMQKGIDHIETNDKMKTAGRYLAEKADTISNLAIAAGLSHLVQ